MAASFVAAAGARRRSWASSMSGGVVEDAACLVAWRLRGGGARHGTTRRCECVGMTVVWQGGADEVRLWNGHGAAGRNRVRAGRCEGVGHLPRG